jgi:CRISPR-associated protein Cas1
VIVLEIPAIQVDQVVVFGRNTLTSAAIVCCMQHGIAIALLSRLGRFYGRIEPAHGETVNLLSAQFALHGQADFGLTLARSFVQGKLSNSALLVSRYSRHRTVGAAVDAKVHDVVLQLRDHQRRLRNMNSLDALRGHEGAGSAAYFSAWRHWLAPRWQFGAREQQAGKDPINALLDFGYTLLHNAAAGLIQARGLNPWLGHLHALKSGHRALASDVMEEFRSLAVDAVVLNLCLNGGLTPADFIHRDGAYTLRADAARNFIRALEVRWNAERQHPRHHELLDLRRIIDGQIRDLCTAYRTGDAASFQACEFR